MKLHIRISEPNLKSYILYTQDDVSEYTPQIHRGQVPLHDPIYFMSSIMLYSYHVAVLLTISSSNLAECTRCIYNPYVCQFYQLKCFQLSVLISMQMKTFFLQNIGLTNFEKS